jgi:spore coat protein U-like protein
MERAMKSLVKSSLLALATGAISIAHAATDSTTFQVKLTISETCDIHTVAATDVDFGTQARQSAAVNISRTGSLTVNCSPSTPYSIGLDGGSNGSATPAPGERKMKSAAAVFVPYDLYQDAALTQFWGNASGTWISGTGTGANQVYSVYGQIKNLNFQAGTYVDTVKATVTY